MVWCRCGRLPLFLSVWCWLAVVGGRVVAAYLFSFSLSVRALVHPSFRSVRCGAGLCMLAFFALRSALALSLSLCLGGAGCLPFSLGVSCTYRYLYRMYISLCISYLYRISIGISILLV